MSRLHRLWKEYLRLVNFWKELSRRLRLKATLVREDGARQFQRGTA